MKRAIVALALLLASAGLLAGQAGAADAAPAGVERLQELDSDILAGLNATRRAHGLQALVVSEELQDAALAHSRAMLEGGFFAHDSPNGTSFVTRIKHYYSPAGFSSWSAGENLIYNTQSLDAAEAIQAWLASPAHRENMLDPRWREVGIGSMRATSAGGTFGGAPTWVVTVDFGFRSGKTSKTTTLQRTVKKAKAKKPTRAQRARARSGKRGQTTTKQATQNAQPKPATREIDRVLPSPAAFGHNADRTADGNLAAEAGRVVERGRPPTLS